MKRQSLKNFSCHCEYFKNFKNSDILWVWNVKKVKIMLASMKVNDYNMLLLDV